MILCLEKTSIWGEFQLGDMEGVLFMRDRPWEVSISDHGGCVFEWRGVDQSTGDIYANSDEHWGEMRFLGNGDIEGTFYNVISDKGDQLDCEFWGHRTSGRNETRAPRGAYSIRDEYFELGSGCD
ncbi:uncharacterized protein BDV14DRAFT_164206 [Aspergillus stella-maris]|uniref:uncharacterized protein n=1 Tax=Aspergillus stella-maris TaxID=1810926 RepID=UPI003CCDD42C